MKKPPGSIALALLGTAAPDVSVEPIAHGEEGFYGDVEIDVSIDWEEVPKVSFESPAAFVADDIKDRIPAGFGGDGNMIDLFNYLMDMHKLKSETLPSRNPNQERLLNDNVDERLRGDASNRELGEWIVNKVRPALDRTKTDESE